jgi:hypothetical protein
MTLLKELSSLAGFHSNPSLGVIALSPYQCMVDYWLQYRVGWYFSVQGQSTEL